MLTRSCILGLSRKAKILVTILAKKLIKLVGLNWVGNCWIFGKQNQCGVIKELKLIGSTQLDSIDCTHDISVSSA
jgi:hypothetical protein